MFCGFACIECRKFKIVGCGFYKTTEPPTSSKLIKSGAPPTEAADEVEQSETRSPGMMMMAAGLRYAVGAYYGK
jgi:hypothetical protein